MTTGVWFLNGMESGFLGMTRIDKLRGTNKSFVFTKIFGDKEAGASNFSFYRRVFPKERLEQYVEGLKEADSFAFRKAIEYIFISRNITWEINK